MAIIAVSCLDGAKYIRDESSEIQFCAHLLNQADEYGYKLYYWREKDNVIEN